MQVQKKTTPGKDRKKKSTPKNKLKDADIRPGFYPVFVFEPNEKVRDLEKVWQAAVFFYSGNRMSDIDHMNTFFDFIQYADVSRILKILSDRYFINLTSPDPILFAKQDIDDFALLIGLLTEINKTEMEYLKADRKELIDEHYPDYAEFT